jgi:hypothetical protein
MEVTLGAIMASYFFLFATTGRGWTRRSLPMFFTKMLSKISMPTEFKVTAATRIYCTASMMCHMDAQLMEIEERFVTFRACVLFFLVFLYNMQPTKTNKHESAFRQHRTIGIKTLTPLN